MASVAVASESRDLERILLFSGSDLWSQGGFAYGGALWAPGGLDHEGFVFKVLLGGGEYRYLSGALGNTEVRGRQLVAFAMPGWRFQRGIFTVTAFAGLDIQHHRLAPFDPGSSLNGTKAGLRAGVEMWCEPTPDTMLAVDASVSTIGAGHSARAAFGWRLFDSFYVGPEMQGYGADDDYRQFRVGLHVTGLRSGFVEWSAGLGYVEDNDDRAGLYGRVGVIARQ